MFKERDLLANIVKASGENGECHNKLIDITICNNNKENEMVREKPMRDGATKRRMYQSLPGLAFFDKKDQSENLSNQKQKKQKRATLMPNSYSTDNFPKENIFPKTTNSQFAANSKIPLTENQPKNQVEPIFKKPNLECRYRWCIQICYSGFFGLSSLICFYLSFAYLKANAWSFYNMPKITLIWLNFNPLVLSMALCILMAIACNISLTKARYLGACMKLLSQIKASLKKGHEREVMLEICSYDVYYKLFKDPKLGYLNRVAISQQLQDLVDRDCELEVGFRAGNKVWRLKAVNYL